MTTSVLERFGSLSATGLATEPTFGATTAATDFFPMTGNSLELDPSLFWPAVMMGQRDSNIFGLYGQNKNAGSISGPLFPSNANSLIPAAIGLDGGQVGSGPTASGGGAGVTGTTPTHATTVSGALLAGATSMTVASATGWAIGQICQIDVNGAGPPATTAECRKVANLVGAVVTFDVPLNFTHVSGCATTTVVGPYTHAVNQANTLPSLTVEKNLGGAESLQFSGSKVNKYSLAAGATNQEVQVTADIQSKHAGVLSTPTPVSVVDELPFTGFEGTLTLNGQTVAQTKSVDLTIENGLKDTYTMNGSHDLQFLSAITRKISGKATIVFHNFDDATWGYWNLMATGMNMGTFTLAFNHPVAANGSVSLTMPYTRINKYSDAVKQSDGIETVIDFDMGLQLSSLKTISATIVNSTYLPY